MNSQQIMSHLVGATLFGTEVLAFTISLATLITANYPSRSGQKKLDNLLQFLNILAGNVGTNRNADDQ